MRLLTAGTRLDYLPAAPGGNFRLGEEECLANGIGSLAEWRDRILERSARWRLAGQRRMMDQHDTDETRLTQTVEDTRQRFDLPLA